MPGKRGTCRRSAKAYPKALLKGLAIALAVRSHPTSSLIRPRLQGERAVFSSTHTLCGFCIAPWLPYYSPLVCNRVTPLKIHLADPSRTSEATKTVLWLCKPSWPGRVEFQTRSPGISPRKNKITGDGKLSPHECSNDAISGGISHTFQQKK